TSPEVIAALKSNTIARDPTTEKIYLETLQALTGSTHVAVVMTKEAEEQSLLTDITDVDEKVQNRALLQLQRKDKVSAAFVPGLVKNLSSRDTLNVWYACEALTKTGEAGKPAIEPLKALITLNDLLSKQSRYCINALVAIAPSDKGVLTFLNDIMMNKKSYSSQEDAAMALAKSGEHGLPYLMKVLASDDSSLIYIVTAALTQTTGDATKAVPVLLELLHHPQKLEDRRPADGSRTVDNILAAIAHIVPNSEELKQAQQIVDSMSSPTR
ncbi:MAG: hypothetical protein WCJ33_00650, partial [Pseudomonadota bacterium]